MYVVLPYIKENTHSCGKYIEFNCVISKYIGLSGIMYIVMCYQLHTNKMHDFKKVS